MTTWNTIARSKRVEWRRKEAGKHFTVTLNVDTSRWDAAFRRIPAGAVAGPLEIGHLMRAALYPFVPEGPPYTHTYTPGHAWDWEYLEDSE